MEKSTEISLCRDGSLKAIHQPLFLEIHDLMPIYRLMMHDVLDDLMEIIYVRKMQKCVSQIGSKRVGQIWGITTALI